MSKVLIGVPTYRGHAYCRERFVARLKELGADVLVYWNGPGEPWGFDGFKVRHYIVGLRTSGLRVYLLWE